MATHRPLTRQAIDAINACYGTKPDLPSGAVDEGDREWRAGQERERLARQRVTFAIERGETSVAQLALATGLRQLLVARLMDNPALRADALASARRDAERYAQDVRDYIRLDTLRAIEDGMSESEAARLYRVDRMTIRAWLGKR